MAAQLLTSLFRLALNPMLSGSLLLVFGQSCLSLHPKLFELVPRLSNQHDLSLARRTVRALFGLGVVWWANCLLNWWAQGHWNIRNAGEPWDFSGEREVAVVTGGSSGFGLLIAMGLQRKCRVAVLDVQQPHAELLKC